MNDLRNTICPLCWNPTAEADLKQVDWLDARVLDRIAKRHPFWRREDGACPACVQEALLETLHAYGDAALHAGIQAVWPLDAEAAFGALPAVALTTPRPENSVGLAVAAISGLP